MRNAIYYFPDKKSGHSKITFFRIFDTQYLPDFAQGSRQILFPLVVAIYIYKTLKIDGCVMSAHFNPGIKPVIFLVCLLTVFFYPVTFNLIKPFFRYLRYIYYAEFKSKFETDFTKIYGFIVGFGLWNYNTCTDGQTVAFGDLRVVTPDNRYIVPRPTAAVSIDGDFRKDWGYENNLYIWTPPVFFR